MGTNSTKITGNKKISAQKQNQMKGIIALILFPCFCGSNAPLLRKSTWKTGANFLTPGKEKKFNGSHKSFSGISSDHEYVDVSNEIIEELRSRGKVPWLFFEHSESRKLFAENVDEKDRNGITALHCATFENLPQVAKALIETGVDVNAKNRWERTALHYAATFNHLQMGKMLIDAGADVRAEDKDKETPLDCAKW